MAVDSDKVARLVNQLECITHNFQGNLSITKPSRALSRQQLLAAKALLKGEVEACLAMLKEIDPEVPADATSQMIAGHAYWAGGRMDEAMCAFNRVVKIAPGYADCWLMLGKICEAKKATELSAQYYTRALMFERGSHEAPLALARILTRQRKLRAAIHTLRVALLHDRRSPKLNLALAKLLKRRIQNLTKAKSKPMVRLVDEALRCYEIAICACPTSATYLAKGSFELFLERFAEAQESFKEAVKRNPKNQIALSKLAVSCVESGELDVALQLFQSSLALKPDCARTHFHFARAKRFTLNKQTEKYILQLETLLSNPATAHRDRVHLLFALGKVNDDIGIHEVAWESYDCANKLKVQHCESRRGRRLARLHSNKRTHLPSHAKLATDGVRGFFAKETFATPVSYPPSDIEPVFIVGMPRSGTTLTEQILSSHPSVSGAGELQWIERIRMEMVVTSRRKQDKETMRQSRANYPNLLNDLSPSQMAQYRETYLDHLRAARVSERYVTDKMPTNFMHLGLIALLFPSAKIIHCQRNPMDVLVSCYTQSLSFPFCHLEMLVEYYLQYRRLMNHWETVLPIQIHHIEYEAVVTDPKPCLERMLDYLDLPWDDRCLQFHKNERAVHTPSKWQVRQPLYTSSIEKWKRFETHLGPIEERLQQALGADDCEYSRRSSDLLSSIQIV